MRLDLQFAHQTSIANGTHVVFPRLGQASTLTDQDFLDNKTNRRMIVRKLSIYSGDPAAGRFDLRLKKHRSGLMAKDYGDDMESLQISSYISPYLGDTRVYRLKLWKPTRLVKGGNQIVHVGGTNLRTEFDFNTSYSGTFDVGLLAVGVESGRHYELGHQEAVTTGSYKHIFRNHTGEPLDIYQINLRGDSTYIYPLLALFGRFRTAIPFWLVADPFPFARIDFSFMPLGGLPLDPYEGILIVGDNNSGTTQDLIVGMESYTEVP